MQIWLEGDGVARIEESASAWLEWQLSRNSIPDIEGTF